MRFRKLDLVRYGGFADRSFAFGDGATDLHLIVGPNEAGKSTLLEAISDLLFGFPGQSTQNWRYDYTALRIQALIEQDGRTTEVIRRKGNKDTLLQADGTPFPIDPIAPLLAGLDRAAFQHMFGLDHETLRAGGRTILEGRDDAARIVLEAGTGLAGLGAAQTRLEELAGALFKTGGQKPRINQLLTGRAAALKTARSASLSETELEAIKQSRDEAEARRQELLQTAAAIEQRHARLDRVNRARQPLVRLTQAQEGLAELGGVPDLSPDIAARLSDARERRTTARARAVQLQEDQERVATQRASIALPDAILDARADIEALEERRPAIAKAAGDLPRRLSDLAAVNARIDAARKDARLPDGAALPAAGWRKRASLHLAAHQAFRADKDRSAQQARELALERGRLDEALAPLQDGRSPAELLDALSAVPAAGLADLKDEADQLAHTARQRLAALAPWRGDVAQLAALTLPSPAKVSDLLRQMESAQQSVATETRAAEAARDAIIRVEARLAALLAGGELPTDEAIASARAARDSLLLEVRGRLGSRMGDGDREAGEQLADAMTRADRLADRRDSEAKRLADHAAAMGQLHEARGLLALAQQRRDEAIRATETAKATWAGALETLGFEEPIPPADFTTWTKARELALQAHDEAERAGRRVHAAQERLDQAAARLRAILAASDLELPSSADDLVSFARARSAEWQAQHQRLLTLTAQRDRLDAQAQKRADEERQLEAQAARLSEDRTQLLSEAGLPVDLGEANLFDAVEALSSISEDLVKRDGFERQVAGIQADADAFAADLAAVLARLGRTASGHALDTVQALTAELRQAVTDFDRRQSLQAEHRRVDDALRQAEQDIAVAQARIDEFCARAAVTGEEALDALIAASERKARLRQSEAEAVGELGVTGAALTALKTEVEALPAETAETELARLRAEREENAASREAVGRELAEAEQRLKLISSASEAADAQQEASDAGGAIAAAAERYIELASSAAVLRWLVDKHRTTSQAPLIARAGQIFAEMTRGAFQSLTVVYDQHDRPAIVALRSDGAQVGPEAMSEGSRDQLFLSLRLASLSGRAGFTPLPFICDDILITSDDERAGAMLKALSSASQSMQVLVLSHHEHVIEIARQAIGSERFHLHRIAPASAPSLAAQ